MKELDIKFIEQNTSENIEDLAKENAPNQSLKKNLSNNDQNSQPSKPFNPSEFRGIFSKEEGKRFIAYITKARSEWDRKF